MDAYEIAIMSFERAAWGWKNMVQHSAFGSAVMLVYDSGCYEKHLSEAKVMKNGIY